jgi:hypothetical protein
MVRCKNPMSAKYTNIMLTIIALCLVILVVNSLRPESRTVPVTIQGIGMQNATLPVTLDEPVNVTITGVEINKALQGIDSHVIPVEISR